MLIQLKPLYPCFFSVSSEGSVELSFNHNDAGYFLKSLYTGHDHGPTVEESVFVVNNGHDDTTIQARYGPYAAQQNVASALSGESHLNESQVLSSVSVSDGLLDVSGHIVSRSLTLDSPILQVRFINIVKCDSF